MLNVSFINCESGTDLILSFAIATDDLMKSISTAVHAGFIQLSKVANFLLPTDEKACGRRRPTDLGKSFSCLIPRGLKKPTDKAFDQRASSIRGKIEDVIRWPLFIRWAIF